MIPFLQILIILGILAIAPQSLAEEAGAAGDEFIVYGVYSTLNMGNPGEKSFKDYYINMGLSLIHI